MNSHSDEIADLFARRNVRLATVYELMPPDGLAAEQVANGDFESWSSATDLDSWTETTTGGTVNQETTIVHGGSNAVRMTKTSAASVAITQTITGALKPGKWYHFTVWTQTPDGASGTPQAVIRNTTQTEDLQDDGSWAATGPGNYFDLPEVDGEWRRFSIWFQVSTAHLPTDSYVIGLREIAAASGDFYFDDCSLMGPYDRKALHFGPRALTWAGDAYEARAIKTTAARDSMKAVQSRLDLTLGNADRFLRQYIDPDSLNGGALIARVLALDASHVPIETYSQIYWQGIMQRPLRGKNSEITISAVGKLNGRRVPAPGRRLASWCQVRRFADGVDCGYTFTTLANGVGINDTALQVDDGTNLENGQMITVGNGEPVEIASGGGTINIVLAEPRHWFDNDPVAYSDCDRQWPRCEKRQRTHEYQGFRAVLAAHRLAFDAAEAYKATKPDFGPFQGGALWEWLQGRPPPYLISGDKVFADPSAVVPILIGRRWIKGVIVEQISYAYGEGPDSRNKVIFQVLAEGEINDILAAKLGGNPFSHRIQSGGAGVTMGYYWRSGVIGITGTETILIYQGNPLVQQRPQNTDHRTATSTTLSRTAYSIALVQQDNSEGTEYDVEGMLLQKYLATGAVDGSPVYTPNPIWGCVELSTHRRFALNLLPASDLDMAVNKPEADYCDAQLASALAVALTTAADTSDEVPIDSIEGFFRGQTVDVGSNTGLVIEEILSETLIRVDSSITFGSGDAVQGYVNRFEAHYYEASPDNDAVEALSKLLFACRGYVTQDHHAGKVQFRVERAHVSDMLVNGALDDWTASVPDGWTKTTLGGTITEETTLVHTAGGSAAKLARTGGGILFLQQDFAGLVPGQWYLFSLWVYSDTAMSSALSVQIKNTSLVLNTWEANPNNLTPVNPVPFWTSGGPSSRSYEHDALAGQWVKIAIAFRWADDASVTDTFRTRLYHGATGQTGTNVYIDDVKLEGPLAGYLRDTDTVWPSAEVLDGSGMEDWSGGPPDGWVLIETGGTITEETGNVYSGSSAAKLVRTSDSDALYMAQTNRKLFPGRTYELTGWTRIVSGDTEWPRFQLQNASDGNLLRKDGTWGVSGAPALILSKQPDARRGSWRYFKIRFVVDPSASVEDNFTLRLFANDTNPSEVYYDDVRLTGPLDATKISQPGMGILKDSFGWLDDEADRRDTNQVAIGFVNEDEEGATDEAVENDFAAQRDMGYVKRVNLNAKAVAHMDHASRLALHHKAKLRDLGPGCDLDTGWHGLLIQPGDIVAVRHEEPNWTGDLKRVVQRVSRGLGEEVEFTAMLKLEDYQPGVYPEEARAPSASIARPAGSITLTAEVTTVAGENVGSMRGVVFSFPLDGATMGVIGFELHKYTSASFVIGSDTKVAETTRDEYTYFPTLAELGTTTYWKVKCRLDRGIIVSNEVALVFAETTDGQLDPGGLDQSQPYNLVYDGDFNDPTEWGTNTNATTDDVEPTGSSDGALENQFTSRANAYDNDTGTNSPGFSDDNPGVLAHKNVQSIWDWAAESGTKNGLVQVRLQHQQTVGSFADAGTLTLEYSTNSGSSWIVFATTQAGTGSTVVIESELLSGINIALLELRITGRPFITDSNAHSNAQNARILEIDFVENLTATILGAVGGGRGTLLSDGATAGELPRPFPGRAPSVGALLSAGDKYTTRLRCRHLGTAPDADVEVILRNVSTDTEFVLLTIPYADITSSDQEWANLWTAPSDQTGAFEIILRTLSTEAVSVDRLSVQAGQQITQAMSSLEETVAGVFPDTASGRTDSFPAGPWAAAAKKTTVS